MSMSHTCAKTVTVAPAHDLLARSAKAAPAVLAHAGYPNTPDTRMQLCMQAPKGALPCKPARM